MVSSETPPPPVTIRDPPRVAMRRGPRGFGRHRQLDVGRCALLPIGELRGTVRLRHAPLRERGACLPSAPMSQTTLFSHVVVGHLSLANRSVMAPMTRSRAEGNVPNALMAEYYAQRASAGLIITEGTSKYAILTAYDTAATSIGAIQLVNITTAATPVLAGSVISAPGVRAAAYDTFDGSGVLVIGYPGRANGSTSGAGAVDLHTVTGGAIAATASDTLQIPNGDSNHLFGRAVTTTRYNGQPIVVVAADNVVYSFYQTSLYAKR